ncbi:hypothetical protein SS1G_04870 [Sclerotinia sclerotiorum 1980 UF-70]|uniref:Uncharacterized protein n=1 Tax=Sclerotinia sclerotiorum (strain ATCC 18683 / 1980 / Ss-1) TaxID=665079 RepID=A7EHS8_SCLS1|nr:hypothetical protein SS1G_04870 [Sclerotinia sclerotiorum 1980 UF-70]EDO02394.1 hypothetical protein SS1G_04870 [Sclerotinia sclerotiorum 1980 UF-70]
MMGIGTRQHPTIREVLLVHLVRPRGQNQGGIQVMLASQVSVTGVLAAIRINHTFLRGGGILMLDYMTTDQKGQRLL